MQVNPHAGKPPEPASLVNVAKLITAYYRELPDPTVRAQRVSFGTSGHRGSALEKSFNEWHILAITQAICEYRKKKQITGPLYLGMDTHALSVPALATALEVLAAAEVDVMIAEDDGYTPTPVISHAIVTYNRHRKHALADGIVITPSHNPPQFGGIKYNPPHGGPAESAVTAWIEARANALLLNQLKDVKRISFSAALRAPTTHRHDFQHAYVEDLAQVIDMAVIRDARINMGVDPLGGAGIHYWRPIADRYGLNLTVVNELVDPTFRFMTVDYDGEIRMDPSSPYAMQRLIRIKDRFDISFACDPDHDRHGIVTRSAGLMQSNHYLAVMVYFLLQHRPEWDLNTVIGKTVVTSWMVDRVAEKLGRSVQEFPVGFKYFVDGLLNGLLRFAGEESAGATFARRDGAVWTTDKDGIVPALLSAEIMARIGRDPGEIYRELTDELGNPASSRRVAPATPEQRMALQRITPAQVHLPELAGEKVESLITRAPANNAEIGGIKAVTQSGWFAARPSGTEDFYRIYAESFRGEDHLQRILFDAQALIDDVLSAAKPLAELPPTVGSPKEA